MKKVAPLALALAIATAALSGVVIATPASAAPAAAGQPDLMVSRPDDSPLNGFFGGVYVNVTNNGTAPATAVALTTTSPLGRINAHITIDSIAPGETVREAVANLQQLGDYYVGFITSTVREAEVDRNTLDNSRTSFEVFTNFGLA